MFHEDYVSKRKWYKKFQGQNFRLHDAYYTYRSSTTHHTELIGNLSESKKCEGTPKVFENINAAQTYVFMSLMGTSSVVPREFLISWEKNLIVRFLISDFI